MLRSTSAPTGSTERRFPLPTGPRAASASVRPRGAYAPACHQSALKPGARIPSPPARSPRARVGACVRTGSPSMPRSTTPAGSTSTAITLPQEATYLFARPRARGAYARKPAKILVATTPTPGPHADRLRAFCLRTGSPGAVRRFFDVASRVCRWSTGSSLSAVAKAADRLDTSTAGTRSWSWTSSSWATAKASAVGRPRSERSESRAGMLSRRNI